MLAARLYRTDQFIPISDKHADLPGDIVTAAILQYHTLIPLPQVCIIIIHFAPLVNWPSSIIRRRAAPSMAFCFAGSLDVNHISQHVSTRSLTRRLRRMASFLHAWYM